jgi:hypothetical protein
MNLSIVQNLRKACAIHTSVGGRQAIGNHLGIVGFGWVAHRFHYGFASISLHPRANCGREWAPRLWNSEAQPKWERMGRPAIRLRDRPTHRQALLLALAIATNATLLGATVSWPARLCSPVSFGTSSLLSSLRMVPLRRTAVSSSFAAVRV